MAKGHAYLMQSYTGQEDRPLRTEKANHGYDQAECDGHPMLIKR